MASARLQRALEVSRAAVCSEPETRQIEVGHRTEVDGPISKEHSAAAGILRMRSARERQDR